MAMTVLLLLLFVTLAKCSKTNMTIYKITASADNSTRKTSEFVQQIAIDEINANPHILRDYHLTLEVLDSLGDSETALENAINISQLYDDCSRKQNSSLIAPIVMGAPWSAFSVLTSRVFNIYHLLQISASSTSPALSEKDNYSSFYRTIANDNVQGKALIELCIRFGWQKIGVVYQNDNYGQNFYKVIQEEADEYNLLHKEGKECIDCIHVHSKSFFFNDTDSIQAAANHIKNEKLYVTILIAQGSDVYNFFTLQNFSYPYFFIGIDAWFDAGEIISSNIANVTVGFVGTMPGSPAMFTRKAYKESNIYDANMTIYNVSNGIYKNVTAKLKRKIKEDPLEDFEIISTIVGYAYDAIYSAVYALEAYDNKSSLKQQLLDCNVLENISNSLHEIMNNIEFIGMTGPVTFKDGERVKGLLLYGIVEANGANITIRNLGHFANGSANITIAHITYPGSSKPIRSDIVVSDALIGISVEAIGIVGGIYAFLCVLALVLSYKKRKAEGKIEYLSITIGLILNCILMVSYGVQKNANVYIGDDEYQIWYDMLCVSSPIIVCVAFTFSFLAFITSKSELMNIIIKFMKQEKFGQYKGDENVSNKLAKCLIADFVVFSIWIGVYFIVYYRANDVKLLQHDFIKMGELHDTVDRDPMEKIQDFYPICASHWSTNIFYCILLIYKIIQMIYAIDSNVGGMVSYMILIVCLCCIGLIAASWYTLSQMLFNEQIHQNAQYSILSFIIIFVYLLWIIPEFYYLFCKLSVSDTDPSSTGDRGDSTLTNMCSHNNYSHLLAKDVEEICKIDMNDGGQINEDIKSEQEDEDGIEMGSKIGQTETKIVIDHCDHEQSNKVSINE